MDHLLRRDSLKSILQLHLFRAPLEGNKQLTNSIPTADARKATSAEQIAGPVAGSLPLPVDDSL